MLFVLATHYKVIASYWLVTTENSIDSSSSSGSVIPIVTGSVVGAALFIISCLVNFACKTIS